MRELLDQLLASLDTGRPVAWCRLVETRGSTPQKPGAAMLVWADGSQAGTLGGGCVEAEVKRRALAILAEGQATIVSFQLDGEYGWDDGLICGGRMQILVEPLSPSSTEADYFRALRALVAEGRGATEAIVFDSQASGLPSPRAWLFDAAGHPTAGLRTAPGEPAPPQVVGELPSVDSRPRPYAARGIAYLASWPRSRLVIVGAGHVGQAVAQLAPDLDFDVWVVDDRADYASRERFPRAERLLTGEIGQVLSRLEIDERTYCVIVTRGHNHDEQALFHLVQSRACYVGMIGSRRKIKLIFDDLAAEGISPEALANVHAPIGLEIGSQTVPEIAVSILAELVAHRNLGGRKAGMKQEYP